MKSVDVANVGVPDPELKSSPILDSEIEDGEFFGADRETGVCYFNGIRYPDGDFIYSGDDILRCENGVWVRTGARHE
jgi:hypothetical protein